MVCSIWWYTLLKQSGAVFLHVLAVETTKVFIRNATDYSSCRGMIKSSNARKKHIGYCASWMQARHCLCCVCSKYRGLMKRQRILPREENVGRLFSNKGTEICFALFTKNCFIYAVHSCLCGGAWREISSSAKVLRSHIGMRIKKLIANLCSVLWACSPIWKGGSQHISRIFFSGKQTCVVGYWNS